MPKIYRQVALACALTSGKMSDLELPTLDELARMSIDFDFVYPVSYTHFIRAAKSPVIVKGRPDLGWFVRSPSDLGAIPEIIGISLIPFYVQGHRQRIGEHKPSDFVISRGLYLFCFDLASDAPLADPLVSMFANETTTRDWPNFLTWLAWAEGRTER